MDWKEVPREVMAKAIPGSINLRGFIRSDELKVIVSLDAGRHHISVSRPDRLPSWLELVECRFQVTPDDVFMIQCLPPREFWVNEHEFCLHLWETRDPHLEMIMKGEGGRIII